MMWTFESIRTRIAGFTRNAGFACGAEFAHAAGRVRTPAIVLGAILAGAAAVPESVAAQDFQWRGRLEAGRTLEVKGVLGGIRAVPTDGDEIEIEAVKTARRSDPEEVRFEVVEHRDGVTICAVYPDVPGERRNVCAPGDGGRMSTRNNDVNVEFTVRVPRTVRLEARTVNGGVHAESLHGDVVAATVNGDIEVSTAGTARARTVNGSIRAALGRIDGADDIAFETVNGGITIELPAGAGADVRASTVNGGISTDFPLQVEGRINRRRVRGTIGSGGPELSLSTVNGAIRIRKAS